MEGWQQFLDAYPKGTTQIAKIRSLWRSGVNQPETVDEILSDVCFRKTNDDWTKDGGKYVPAPDKYLARQLWLEPAAVIARLTHELDRHPGNHDSIHHNPQAPLEVIEEFKAKRTCLNKLRESK